MTHAPGKRHGQSAIRMAASVTVWGQRIGQKCDPISEQSWAKPKARLRNSANNHCAILSGC